MKKYALELSAYGVWYKSRDTIRVKIVTSFIEEYINKPESPKGNENDNKWTDYEMGGKHKYISA